MEKNIIYFTLVSLFAILVLITILIFFNGNENKKEYEVNYLIGIAHADLSETWQISLDQEIKDEIKQYNDVQIITTNANGSTYKQMKDIETLIAYGIDILIITPNDSTIIKREIKKANDMIPVIVLNTDLSGNDYTMFIGPDYYAIGEKAGKRAIEILQDRKGNIVEIKGTFDVQAVNNLDHGFWDIANSADNILLYTKYSADWKKDEAKRWFKDYVKSRQIDLVFAHNDAMAIGAYEGAMEVDEEIAGKIEYIGLGAISESNIGVQAVKEGKLNTTYVWSLGGKEAIQYAVEILKGKNSIPKKLILRNQEITKENVDKYLGDNKQNESNEYKNIQFGFIQSSSYNQWKREEIQSVINAAIEKDMNIILKEINSNQVIEKQQEEQINYIYELIDKKVDIIVLSPVVQDGWKESLEKARENNIPVVIVDNLILSDDELWSFYLGYDSVNEGFMAAKWIVNNLYNAEVDIKIAEIMENSKSYSSKKRTEGFQEIIAGYSRIEIVEKFDAKNLEKDIKNGIKEIMENRGDEINVIFAHDEFLALEATEILKDYGKKPGKDIHIVCIGGTEELHNSLAKGEISCIVESSPDLGPLLIRYIIDLMDNKNLPQYIMNGNKVLN